MKLDRGPLLADRTSTGGQWCARYSRLVDGWLAGLFDAAGPPASGLALVAVGGYGRSELCPASDIDVMLVHAKSRQVARMAEAMWYPIWDEGLKLGHSVCTVSEALRLAGDEPGIPRWSPSSPSGPRANGEGVLAGGWTSWPGASRSATTPPARWPSSSSPT